MSVSVDETRKDDCFTERFNRELRKPVDDFSLSTDACDKIAPNRHRTLLNWRSRNRDDPTRRINFIHLAAEGSCRAAPELFALLSARYRCMIEITYARVEGMSMRLM